MMLFLAFYNYVIHYVLVKLKVMCFLKVKLSVAFIFLSLITIAQPRHSAGIKMFGGGYASNFQLNTIMLSGQSYYKDNIWFDAGLTYNRVDFKNSDYYSFSVYPSGYYTVLSNYKNLFLNAQIGCEAGFEYLNNYVFGNKNRFYFSESLGFKGEFYLRYNLKLEGSICQFIYQKSLALKYVTKFSLGMLMQIN
jgi:hypothetical protein